MAAIAYRILQATIIRGEETGSRLAQAVGSDFKGKLSPILYAAGIGAAFFLPQVSVALYVATALLWLIPDRRIERTMARSLDLT